ncbi:hypothetical protein BHAP_0697 [Bifidobacterium hapali]|uniref:Uncharacterized protein n=1 Tax=Bifidobacterium hapali TaxID=1630172 RepID=A0A261G1Z5_9BIFI|nr:hypothetical protein BHAP_0697 [Bifidobacterium hapali]
MLVIGMSPFDNPQDFPSLWRRATNMANVVPVPSGNSFNYRRKEQ